MQGYNNLDNWKRRQTKILTHIADELLHVPLIRLSITLMRRVTLPLVPKQTPDFSTTFHALFRPHHHALVQLLPTRPLLYGGPTHSAWDQPHHPHALPHRVGERHPGPHPANLLGVDVGVERLTRRLPVARGAESEDCGGVGLALLWNDAVPFVVFGYAAAAGHVALT